MSNKIHFSQSLLNDFSTISLHIASQRHAVLLQQMQDRAYNLCTNLQNISAIILHRLHCMQIFCMTFS